MGGQDGDHDDHDDHDDDDDDDDDDDVVVVVDMMTCHMPCQLPNGTLTCGL